MDYMEEKDEKQRRCEDEGEKEETERTRHERVREEKKRREGDSKRGEAFRDRRAPLKEGKGERTARMKEREMKEST